MTDVRGTEDIADVLAAQSGDGQAFANLFDRWFDPVFDVALRIVRNRDTAAEVAQDVFLNAWQQLGSLQQPASFGGWLLRSARNRAFNRLERDRRSVVLGHEETTMEIDQQIRETGGLGDALERAETSDLVWAAGEALGPRDASVLDLHLRHGLSAAEIGEELGLSPNGAHQMLFRLKARLGAAVRASMLWHDGAPECADLARDLRTAGVDRFGAEAVRAINRHAEGCDDCGERQELRVAPEALFAAVPIIGAGVLLKAKSASALEAAGVPMGAATGGGAGGPDAGAAAGGAAAATSHKVRRGVIGALIAAAVILIALVAVLADPLGHGTTTKVESAGTVLTSTTTTAKPSTTTTASTSTTTTSTSTTTTVPVVASTTAPATTARPTTTTVRVTTTATTLPFNGSPTITSFNASQTGTCSTAAGGPGRELHFDWTSANTTRAALAGPGAPNGDLPASGFANFCSPGRAPATFTLTVSGPRGSVTQPATV